MTRALLLTLAALLLLAAPAAAAVPPSVGGQWTKMPDVPASFNGVHLVGSPTGKVLLIAGSGRDEDNFRARTFRSMIYDPRVKPAAWRPVATPVDMFCAGHVLLPDGRALVVGGTGAYPTPGLPSFTGIRAMYAFNFQTESYNRLTPMEVARWYPLAVTMGDGRTVIASGKDERGVTTGVAEVFDWRTNQHQRLPGSRVFPTYADMHLAGTGELFYTGAAFSPTGNPGPGFWNPFTNAYRPIAPIPEPGHRRFATSCFIGDAREQQLMVMGGGSAPATNSTAVIDLDAPNPAYTRGPPLRDRKMMLNCSILPDGSVLEVGGGEDNTVAEASREVGLIRSTRGPWQEMNPLPAGEHRVYHSLLCVLDSGRVLSVTSNPGSSTTPKSRSVLEFTPAYRFRGAPPVIRSAPRGVAYGGRYAIATNRRVTRFAVSPYPAVTHSEDPNQRWLSLPVERDGRITMPADRNVMPPGWYRLWALDARGRPSIAWPIHIS